jgi:inosose dehydratase
VTSLRVGNAPCSWGTLEFEGAKGRSMPFGCMLDELVETGYTGTELGDWGYMPTDPFVLRDELHKRGLVMLGAFVPVTLKDPASHFGHGLDQVLRTARLLSAVASDPKPLLVLADNNGVDPLRTAKAGRITAEHGLSAREWAVFAGGADRIGRIVKEQTGLRTVFHHHCAGYVETPDEIELFLDLTDSAAIGLVFDTGHFAYGAGSLDVVDGLRRFASRIDYVHLKDCSPDVAAMARDGQWDYFQALRHGLFCELGRGGVDFSAVLRWLEETAYSGYVLVEQDVLPGAGTPRESARRNREYLRCVEAATFDGAAKAHRRDS